MGVARVVGDKEKDEEDEACLEQEPKEPQDYPLKLVPVTVQEAVVEPAPTVHIFIKMKDE